MSNLIALSIQAQRKTGQRRSITVLDPAKYEMAFVALRDSSESAEVKAFIAVALSGGCRFSEARALRPVDLDLAAGTFQVKCLKKRSSYTSQHTGETLKTQSVYRTAGLHPIAQELLQAWISQAGVKHLGRIFSVSDSTVTRALQRLMGEHACPHSLRHSHISWQLHHLGQSDLAVMDAMEISATTISSYSHVNKKAYAQNLFKRAA